MGFFKKTPKTEQKGGPFVSFVLLDQAAFDIDQFIADLRRDWNIEISQSDINENRDVIVCELDGMMATVSLMPAPVPNGEAVDNAKTNFRWPDAVAVAREHKAHLLVALLPRKQPLTQAGIAMVKLCCACLKQKNATAVNTLGSVLHPDFYLGFAEGDIKNGNFPLMNLVFFGRYSGNSDTVCAYTYGMKVFCKDEMEILDSTQPADEVMNMLFSIAGYVIEGDVLLQDGETIGFTEEQKLPIRKSAGQAVDGESLKIGF